MPFFRNPFSTPSVTTSVKPLASPQGLSSEEYDAFAKLVYQYSRIELGSNKKEMVAARLAKRLKACNVPNFKSYLQFIQSPAGKTELTHLVDAISTNHTFFFREVAHFEFLKKNLLPQLVNNPQRSNKQFKVWCAAASSGEEPYSVAILLNEFFQAYPTWNWSILATDISTRILEQANKGVYERLRLGSMPKEHVVKYFQPVATPLGEAYQISPLLKAKVNFKQINLLSPSYPFSDLFDLIFCRNVMIYFNLETKQELIQKLSKQLVEGGYLFTGHSESLTGIQHALKSVQVSVFQKN